MSETVVIVDACRTPMGKGHPERGDLRDVHPVILGAHVIKSLVERNHVNAATVEMVAFGCVGQVGEQSTNIARQSVLAAGFPITVPAVTVDHQCGSSEYAIHAIAASIAAGEISVGIAGGVESMSRVPMGSSMLQEPGTPFPPEVMDHYALTTQGIAAEVVAREWGITREQCDEIGAVSQQRAAAAAREGRFTAEIVPIAVPADGGVHTVSADQGIRGDTTVESLSALKPAFREDGILHAGNSSQITDGAAALLLMSATAAQAAGLTPLATIRGQRSVGVDPVTMLTGPIPATEELLARLGLGVNDVDLFEINEAFACVIAAWEHDLGVGHERVNVNGGAIALGHPLGASGARLMTTLVHELRRSDSHRGLQAMCCGGGLGIATLVER